LTDVDFYFKNVGMKYYRQKQEK